MKHDKDVIIEAAINRQKSIIQDLEKRTKEILSNDGTINETEYDSTEQSIKSSLIEEAEMLNDELHFLNEELGELEKLKARISHSTHVAPGAVVETNHGTFFVSASTEEFKVGDSPFFGISVKAPLFKKMKGKRAGDKFKAGKLEYEIMSIY